MKYLKPKFTVLSSDAKAQDAYRNNFDLAFGKKAKEPRCKPTTSSGKVIGPGARIAYYGKSRGRTSVQTARVISIQCRMNRYGLNKGTVQEPVELFLKVRKDANGAHVMLRKLDRVLVAD